MLKVTSAGILLFREHPEKSFLLLKSKKRWDVPKGHVERGESEVETALRELREETGILADQVSLDETFRFQMQAQFKAAYLGGRFVDKTYVVFLGFLDQPVEIKLSEHDLYQWFPWNPPHHISKWLIDPLLQAVAEHIDLQRP
jgi:bis(5'-nucleosidyl)-tetraphosphatase